MTDFLPGEYPPILNSTLVLDHACAVYVVHRAGMRTARPWKAAGLQGLDLCRQDDNKYHDLAVSIVKAENIVSHVPQEMSRTFWHSLGMVEALNVR